MQFLTDIFVNPECNLEKEQLINVGLIFFLGVKLQKLEKKTHSIKAFSKNLKLKIIVFGKIFFIIFFF